MNIAPAGVNTPSSPPDFKNQVLGTGFMEQFANQLSTAEQDISWIEKDSSQIEKDRLNRDFIKEKQNSTAEEQKLLNDTMAGAFFQKNQLDQQIDQSSLKDLVTETQKGEVDFLQGLKNSNNLQNVQILSSQSVLKDAKNKTQLQGQEQFTNSLGSKKDANNQAAVKDRVTRRTAPADQALKPDGSAEQTIKQGFSTQALDANLKNLQGNKINQNLKGQDQTGNRQPVTDLSNAPLPLKFQATAGKAGVQETLTNTLSAQAISQSANNSRTVSQTASSLKSGLKAGGLENITNLDANQLNATKKAESTTLAKPVKAAATQQLNIKDVVGNVRVMISKFRNELVMNLNPEHLGKLEIRLKRDGDSLTGTLKVDNKEAKDLLTSQLDTLKQGLEEQGILVDKFSIIFNDQNQQPNSSFTFNEGTQNQTSGDTSNNSSENRSENEIQTQTATVDRARVESDSALNLYA